MCHPSLATLGLAALGLFGLSACRSAKEHHDAADEEVYQILHGIRDELSPGASFTIEPAPGSLRARILAGELPPANEPLVLGLVESLDVAAENSREYQSERERLYLSALDLTEERWRLSGRGTGTLSAFVSGDGGQSNMSGFLSNIGLTKLFKTGLSLTAGVGVDYLRNFLNGDWDPLSSLSVSLTQPLLRGFGERIVLEPLTQAERDVLYGARSFEAFRRTIALDVASQYFRVLEQIDTLSNEEKNLESLVLLRVRNENFAEAGRLSDIQVDQARQDELRAESRLVDARRNLAARLDDFKLLLGLPVEVELELDPGALIVFSERVEFDLDIDEELAVRCALAERLDHQTTVDQVFDAERRVLVLADALRMGLDITFTGGGTSELGKPLSYSRASKPWSVFLDIDFPIDRLPQRNDFRAGEIAWAAAERRATDSAEGIRSDLRDERRRLGAASRTFEIQSGAVGLAKRRVESAGLNLEAGRANTRDLLEAQESLIQAQNAASGALTDRVLAGLAYLRTLELLRVDENGLSVDLTPLETRIAPKP